MSQVQGTFSIWQIDDDHHNLLFLSSENFRRAGKKIHHSCYNKVYSDCKEEPTSLDGIFVEFNLHHPEGFVGHSLSVSDVISFFDERGNKRAYFVDPIGFRNVSYEFFSEKSV